MPFRLRKRKFASVRIAVQMAAAVVYRGFVLARNALATAVLKTQAAVQQIAARTGLEFLFLLHHLNVIKDAALRKISRCRPVICYSSGRLSGIAISKPSR